MKRPETIKTRNTLVEYFTKRCDEAGKSKLTKQIRKWILTIHSIGTLDLLLMSKYYKAELTKEINGMSTKNQL
ncbi:MAG: hypothetical protein P9M03_06870 [Candidatus Theseobacter exili]|nr:hypothetical protein [Candidatus Theseobacter exili]